jgi:hypothetical protein
MQPFDFWTLFVIYTFGSFWLAVFGLMAMFLVIMILGRMSMYSILWFTLLFVMCMAMGYGYGLVTILIGLFITSRFIFDLVTTAKGRMGL